MYLKSAGRTVSSDCRLSFQASVRPPGPGPGGRTDAWKLSLQSEETVLPALFRYIDRRRPDPLADSYRYDLAAYALSKYLGLTNVCLLYTSPSPRDGLLSR